MKSGQFHQWLKQVLAGFILRALEPIVYSLAFLWRRMLFKTRFILITGSLGKTTTKELLAQILEQHYRTFKSRRNQNARALLLLNVLRVRPWHQFAVIEAATSKPGMLRRSSRLLRPDLAIVLLIAGTHRRGFRSLEETAREKLSVLNGIQRGGVAILNGDDPRLSQVTSNDVFQVSRFGTSPSLDLFAQNVVSLWPDRLSFDVRSAGEEAFVKTKLVGTHWVTSILASLLAAYHCGIPLQEAVRPVSIFKAFPARMQPVELPSGAIVIRDEYNGSPSSFKTALEAFRSAKAQRKILIAGDYSDSTIKRRRRLVRLGRTAAKLCDLAIFIGEHSHHSGRGALQAGLSPNQVLTFSYLRDALPAITKELRQGDLVLLKSRSNDHFSRLVFAQVGEVQCWKPKCFERFLCDICWQLGSDESDRKKIKPI